MTSNKSSLKQLRYELLERSLAAYLSRKTSATLPHFDSQFVGRDLPPGQKGGFWRVGNSFEMEVCMPPVEHVDQTLDCLKLLCPVPIIKISKAVKDLQTGQTLLMLADDPGAKADMIAWAKQTGNELLGIEEEGKVFKFYVRKTK
jgi:tRNA 2-thiouridine synthesizing protein A